MVAVQQRAASPMIANHGEGPMPKRPRRYRQTIVSMSSGVSDEDRVKLVLKQIAEQKQKDEKEQKLMPEQRRCIGSVEIAY